MTLDARRSFDSKHGGKDNSIYNPENSLQGHNVNHQKYNSGGAEGGVNDDPSINRVGMSSSSKLVLVSTAFVQIFLVILLSLDPNIAKEFI